MFQGYLKVTGNRIEMRTMSYNLHCATAYVNPNPSSPAVLLEKIKISKINIIFSNQENPRSSLTGVQCFFGSIYKKIILLFFSPNGFPGLFRAFGPIVLDCPLQSVSREVRAMHLGRWQAFEIVCDVGARNFERRVQIFAFGHLSDHGRCRDRGGASQGFEFDVGDGFLVPGFFHFDVNGHDVAASGISDRAEPVRIFHPALVFRFHEMLENFFGIHNFSI